MTKTTSYLWLLLGISILGLGCGDNDLLTEDLLDSQMASMKIDDLNRTLDFVFSDGRFDQEEFEDKISTGLNRWIGEVIDSGEDNANWSLDPQYETLINDNQDLPVVQRVDDLSFLKSDSYYIQQAAWAKRIGNRVTSFQDMGMYELYRLLGDPDGQGLSFDDITAKLNPAVSKEKVPQLSQAVRLFDWITRNIQILDPQGISEDQYEEFRLNDSSHSNAAAGIPGLGYKHYPWQTLLYGRGEYVQKAKLFMVLCEQMGMSTTMLALPGEGEGELVPWLPAVLIDGELYLFDTQLGLPIPGEVPGSIATLSQVRNNGKLLTDLDLTLEESTRDNTKYRVRPDQLTDVTALIYVSPESISHRMKFLEDRLAGEKRLRLTSDPKPALDELSKIEGVTPQIWDIAFTTRRFRNAVKRAADLVATDSQLIEKLDWYFDEESYVDSFVAYRTARNLYFIGKFESARNSRRANAIQRFRSLMYTDDEIAGLATNRRLMYQLGIMKDDKQDVKSFNDLLRGVQQQMELVRRDAGLFMAQSTFDNGNIGTCANWLRRVDEKGDSERWNTGVKYLTARAFETRKEYKRAIELYSKGEFDQFHGNLIRARLLKKVVDELEVPVAADSGDDEDSSTEEGDN